MKKSIVSAIICIFLGALILLLPVFLNGFPFLFQDSADYLIFTPRIYRSPFYGLFIFLFHLNHFIWMPVVAQALITSHLLYLLAKIYIKSDPFFLLMISLLTLFSSLSFFVGFLMPDLFTALMFIIMYLIGFHFWAFSPALRAYLLLLACIATAAHLSNLMIALVVIPTFLPFLRFRQMFVMLVPSLLTTIAYFAFNSVVFGSISLSPAGQSFFLENLLIYGPAVSYLKENCPQSGLKMCAKINDKFDESFLWSEAGYGGLGGFEGMAQESKTIVLGTIQRYPIEVTKMAIQNFLQALNTHAPAKELTSFSFLPSSSIFEVLEHKFGPRAPIEFRKSAEMRDLLPHQLIETIDSIIVPSSFIMLLAFATRKRDRNLAIFAYLTATFVFTNTLVCATISGVHDRYQARVSWLLPMTCLLFIGNQSVKTNVIKPFHDFLKTYLGRSFKPI